MMHLIIVAIALPIELTLLAREVRALQRMDKAGMK